MSIHDDIREEELMEEDMRENRGHRPMRTFPPCTKCGAKKHHDGTRCNDCAKKGDGQEGQT